MPRLSATEPYFHPDVETTGSSFGAFVAIGQGSRVQYSEIGDYSYCDRYADIANTTVGKFANIASFARIGPTDHPLETASLHHFLYRSDEYWEDASRDEAFFGRRRARRTSVGHDTWIGHAAVIRPEVVIGHGAVVATHAVVTKDVAPYTIVAGIPAQPIRRRLPEAVADRMISLAWWDWSHERRRAALDDFRALPAEAFLDKHGD
jgi:phosphonate metabolism protein (transferase hexapeptide repeat family)